MACTFMGMKASIEIEGKNRLSALTVTDVRDSGACAAARLESNALNTPEQRLRQIEVLPHAWK